MEAKKPFRDFLQDMLARAKINKFHREQLTDKDGMKIFFAVFTDSSYDPNPENNYEELEFIGDGIIKGVLGQYILRRFPDLSKNIKSSNKATGEGVLSKTRRLLEQEKTLSDSALKLGFWDYVRADEETLTQKRKKTLENVFEAFVGAIVTLIDDRIKRGLGYCYAYNFVEASLDEIDISLTKKTLDDPITRLNELYKTNELAGNVHPLKWGDAKYTDEKWYIPRRLELPPVTTAQTGDVIYSEDDKVAQVFDGNRWTHINRIPPWVRLNAPPTGLPREETQSIWYTNVSGFLDNKGHPTFGATGSPAIIGQGLHFLKKESKKIAATQALRYLEKLGYKKAD